MSALKWALTSLLGLSLCACTPRVIYKDVYIPTKCKVIKPTRPPSSLNTLDYLKALLIYTEQLERDLDFCTKGSLG
ncbi:hypothetical protein [Helicobacter mehlei]|uniref:DNA methyltransferase n=1 Tax=Helicobacter mehlei TaxID=2316080 RepID=A0A553UFI0_9HELI|nr:hypothetical protein [Helicobacter mehlei]TSA78781.1 hypothetical protein FNE76_08115 [Helicobacter mehlei]